MGEPIHNECNHDLNTSDNSLIKSKKRKMTCPNIIDCFCPICGRVFRFKQKEDKTFVSIKE